MVEWGWRGAGLGRGRAGAGQGWRGAGLTRTPNLRPMFPCREYFTYATIVANKTLTYSAETRQREEEGGEKKIMRMATLLQGRSTRGQTAARRRC